MIFFLARMYTSFFYRLERLTLGWLLETAARLIFSSVCLVYFVQSGLAKVGPGALGFLHPNLHAYTMILPRITAAAGGHVGQIDFWPWGLVVLLGTWAELALPVMIALGLLTRAASLGMIIFLGVMTYVEIFVAHTASVHVFMFFDVNPSGLLADQRLMWVVPLMVLVLKGGGPLSLDSLMLRLYQGRANYY